MSQLDSGLKTESSFSVGIFYRKIGPRNTEREAKLVVFVMETEKALYFKKLNEAISYVFSPSLPKLLRSRAIQNLELPGKASKLSLLQGVYHSQQEILYK